MTKTAVFKDDLFLEHMAGFSHIESAGRLLTLYDALATEEIGGHLVYPGFSGASHEVLCLNHSKKYVARVAQTAGKDQVNLDPDTQTSPRSYDAACLAAGAVVDCTRMVLAGDIDNGFCLVRPPGHHAEKDRAMGFCLFNNIAVAARYALHELNLERILIVDWDLHHGNGTQHAFYDTDKVLYFSTHLFPFFPGSGAAYEVGTGAGEGCTVNIPLTGGQGDYAFATIFNEFLCPIAREYKPELIMLSAGFDTHRRDPFGGMSVTAKGFSYMTKVLLDLAQELCQGRLVAALEGGYDLIGLREGTLAVLSEMAGHSQLHDKDVLELTTVSVPVPGLEEVRSIVNRYWKI
jgi:acetoin utilization deacetylase AcuC-like enzyme